jgi:hypothetical protein
MIWEAGFTLYQCIHVEEYRFFQRKWLSMGCTETLSRHFGRLMNAVDHWNRQE